MPEEKDMRLSEYVGLPYADRGRDVLDGVDCWGLVRLVYEHELGIMLPSYADEYDTPDSEQATKAITQHKREWKQVRKPQVGDLVLFRARGHDAHVGVFTGRGRFLHSERTTGVVLERLASPRWERRIVGYFRYHT